VPSVRQRFDAIRALVDRDGRFVLATFCASGVGYLGTSAAPIIVIALLQSGLSHARAGDLGTIELTTMAVSSIIVAPFVPRISHRKLALRGGVIAALGVALSALSVDYTAMVLGRVVIGVGSGLAISGANAAVGAREDAERIFAIIWTLGGAVTSILALTLPYLVEGGNYAIGYWVLLILCVAAVPFMAWIPPRPSRYASNAAVESASWLSVGEPASKGRSASVWPLAVLTLGGLFVYSLAEQALWQFAYDIPVDNGIEYEVVPFILGATTFAGLSGGAIAAWLGLARGRVFPIVVGSLLSVAGRWAYISATEIGMLLFGSLLWGIGYYFVSPYQIGLAAGLDRKGRLVVAAAALSNIGFGVGPIIAGRVRQYQIDNDLDATILIFVVAGGTLLSLLMLLPVAIRLDRGSRGVRGAQGPPDAETGEEEV
jgi:MFS family permease